MIGNGLKCPLNLLLGLVLHKLGISGDTDIFSEQAVEDIKRAFARVGVMEIQVLVDFGPGYITVSRIPVPHVLRVLITDIAHDGMALGKFEIAISVFDGGDLAHGVDFLVLFRLHL